MSSYAPDIAEARYQELAALVALALARSNSSGSGTSLVNNQTWGQVTAAVVTGTPAAVTDPAPSITAKKTGRFLVSGSTTGTVKIGTSAGDAQLQVSTNGGATWANVSNADGLLSSIFAGGIANNNTAAAATVDALVTVAVGSVTKFRLLATISGVGGEYDTTIGAGAITAVELS